MLSLFSSSMSTPPILAALLLPICYGKGLYHIPVSVGKLILNSQSKKGKAFLEAAGLGQIPRSRT